VEAIVAHVAANAAGLLAAACVNKLWTDVATSWLWRTRAPSGTALACISGNNGRRAYYDGKVHRVAIGPNTSCSNAGVATYNDLGGWRLPRVRDLTFLSPSMAGASATAALLQRVLQEQQPLGRLHTLKWQDTEAAVATGALSDVIAVLMRHAPRLSLRCLSLDSVVEAPSPAALLALLKALPSLNAITLKGVTCGATDDAVLEYLAHNPRLSHLGMDKLIAQPTLRKQSRVSDVTASPDATRCDGDDSEPSSVLATGFSSLHSLSARVDPGAMPLLADTFRSLAVLDITLYYDFSQALVVITTRLSQLGSLTITFDSGDVPPATDERLDANYIVMLERLACLRWLRLATGPGIINTRFAFDFDDEVLESLVFSLRQLRCLRIELDTPWLSQDSFIVAGARCRWLETLELRGKFWLGSFRDRGSMPWIFFPNLRVLKLRQVSLG
jgi:hypothetical protein